MSDPFWEALAAVIQDEWRDHAACSGMPAEWFQDSEFEEQGKGVCATCPVRLECLDDALVWNDDYLRGGRNAAERLKIDRYRKRYMVQFREVLSSALSGVNWDEVEMRSMQDVHGEE